jgi:hypothetical protein
MDHLTVVPTNASSSSRDEDEAGDEPGMSTDAA